GRVRAQPCRLLGPGEQAVQGVGGTVGGFLESAHDHDADIADDLVDAAGGSFRHAVMQQVGQGGAVRGRAQRVKPRAQVSGGVGLDDPAVPGDLAAPAEVDEVGGEPAEPADQGAVVDIGESEHVADGAHADVLKDLGIRVGPAAVADGVDVPDGGSPEDL